MVPCQPGHDGHGEVPRHHRVHREHQRGGQGGEVEIGPRVVPPLVVGALPADRGDLVDLLPPPGRLVPHRGDVRNQAEHEERGRDREVRGDREDVPDERRLEVGPEEPGVRIGQQPVEDPLAADVDDREEARGHDGEHRHGLGGAIDRRAPGRPEEEQDRRDQRARVSDTHPEHEGGDVHAPEDRRLVSRRGPARP